MVVAMGFSTSTWAPAFRKARTISAWVTAGEQMLTRSTLPSKFTPIGDHRAAMMGLGLGAHVGIGIGNGKQLDVFAGLPKALYLVA